MKCPKCGAEIPAGSKFCNECGTKIEQIALFKDSKPENAEPYKCEKCGNMIPTIRYFALNVTLIKKTNSNPQAILKNHLTKNLYIALHIFTLLC